MTKINRLDLNSLLFAAACLVFSSAILDSQDFYFKLGSFLGYVIICLVISFVLTATLWWLLKKKFTVSFSSVVMRVCGLTAFFMMVSKFM